MPECSHSRMVLAALHAQQIVADTEFFAASEYLKDRDIEKEPVAAAIRAIALKKGDLLRVKLREYQTRVNSEEMPGI